MESLAPRTSASPVGSLRRQNTFLTVLAFVLFLALTAATWPRIRPFLPRLNQPSAALLSPSAASVEGQIARLIEDNYTGSLADVDFAQGRLRGYVGALEDPYTEYLSAEDWAEFNEVLNEEYVGIGIRFLNKVEGYVVEEVIPNSPASMAGLRAGDILYEIEGTLTSEIAFDDVAPRIKGPAGTSVQITLLRGGLEVPVTLRRAPIAIEQVAWEVVDDIGVITISSFGEGLDQKMGAAVADLNAAEVSGIVLDLRGNGGGLLIGAIDVASYFLEPGTTVLRETTKQSQEIYQAQAKQFSVSSEVEVAVLLDRFSASASEIVAGALRDERQARIFGEKSFGKGVVQRVYPLSDGGKLKLTIAEWFTPAGAVINEVGLSPDVPVLPEEEALEVALDALNT